MDTIASRLAGQSINLSFADTYDKQYQVLQSYRNVTSYSMLQELHACARKFQLIKARAAGGGSGGNNVDFAFGHAVGSGIQAYLASNKDMDAAILNAMLAWKLSYDAEIPKKNKSLWNAVLAVQKYAEFHAEQLEDWEVWIMPNGKPAIEVSISVDFGNGYKHYIHIDTILQHTLTGQLAVQENKTSGFKYAEEALYANSSQALSYAVVVDMLSTNASFEVFYVVYSTPDRSWNLMPFTKQTSLKAEWLTDVRLDHATLSTYKQLNFYPKRGESCYNFMRRCEFFGTCNIVNNLPELQELSSHEEAERVDYAFKLEDILTRQRQRSEAESNYQPAGISSID